MKHRRWLFTEIDQWVKDGVISSEQGGALRERYPEPPAGRPWALVILSGVGATLIGLGVILVFAFNWSEMGRVAKLLSIAVAFCAAHGLGFFLRREKGRFPEVGEAIHLLGTMLFGSGIWLIAQIYHIDEHYPNGILVWSLGALAMAWAMPSICHAMLFALLAVIWTGFEVFDFHAPNHWGPVLVLLGLFPLAWQMKSRVVLGAAIPALILTALFSCVHVLPELILPMLLAMACIFFALSVLLKENKRLPGVHVVLRVFAHIIYWIPLYLMTFKGIAEEVFEGGSPDEFDEIAYYAIPALLAVGIWVPVVISTIKHFREKHSYRELSLSVLPLVVLLVYIGCVCPLAVGYGLMILFNLVFLVQAVLLVIDGCRSGKVLPTIFGTILLCMITIARYCDLFEHLLLRALAFLIVGAIVLTIGILFARGRRQLKQQGVQEEVGA